MFIFLRIGPKEESVTTLRSTGTWLTSNFSKRDRFKKGTVKDKHGTPIPPFKTDV